MNDSFMLHNLLLILAILEKIKAGICLYSLKGQIIRESPFHYKKTQFLRYIGTHPMVSQAKVCLLAVLFLAIS